MSESSLPRALELRINRIANDRAHGPGTQTTQTRYRKRYQIEKAALLAQAVTWFAMGKTFDEVMGLLKAPAGEDRTKRKKAQAKLSKAINALKKQIMEMP
jgi:hypothetical protein